MAVDPDMTDFLSHHGYCIERLLGSGRTSTVYVANSTRYPDRQFAIKRLDLVHDASSMRREMAVLCSLSHPNVIKLYEFFEDSQYFYFVLEYCSGGSIMDEIVLNGPLPCDMLLPFSSQIIAGLAYCHSRAVSHGDIKPQNILIDANNHCKLVDFGLSQCLKSNGISTLFLGSLLFMAPEVILKRAYDPFVADIWSLGVTLYWMAIGSSPWPDCTTIMQAVQCGLPPMPLSLPLEFRNLLKAMVEFEPGKRITMQDIVAHPGAQYSGAIERPVARGKGGNAGFMAALSMLPKATSVNAKSLIRQPGLQMSVSRRIGSGRSLLGALNG
jgi:serine/threonine protein kinase